MSDGDSFERLQRELDPNREAEQGAALAETAARLHARGVELSGDERSEDVADLLSAVERFERAVQRLGGDLMVDEAPSLEPDRPEFMLPLRRGDEGVRSYIGRLESAADALQGPSAR